MSNEDILRLIDILAWPVTVLVVLTMYHKHISMLVMHATRETFKAIENQETRRKQNP